MNEIDKNEGTEQVERYNYGITEEGLKIPVFRQGEWIIEKYANYQNEYAPAKDFYRIHKWYHKNGVLSMKVRLIGKVPYGIREYYDEKGRIKKTVDEDAKFGTVKPDDIIKFMEDQGFFNRETGESIFYKNPLPTDGNFYREIMYRLKIYFIQEIGSNAEKIRSRLKIEEYDNEGNIIPYWSISYLKDQEILYYIIDGNDVNNFFTTKEDYIILM